MSNHNNSLLFYKKYYDGVDWSKKSDDKDNSNHFAERNLELTNSTLPEREEELPFVYNIPKEHCIDLETTYPGLLFGSGITHGSGLLGEIKLGFFLDHTTGLPVIPGSSVKGVLRSVFPLGFKHAAKKEKNSKKALLLQEKACWVKEYLQSKLQLITPEQNWDSHAIEAFETWLFGSYETGVKVGPMSGRTIFHDALPLSAARVKINGIYTNQYLATDFITPHKNRKNNGIPDALVNPTPIGFIKVLPGVVFRFQFHLVPYKKDGQELLNIANIRDLFKAILLDIGVGAKTNVGYGQLISSKRWEEIYKSGEKKNQQNDEDTPPPKQPEIPKEYHYSKNFSDGDEREIIGMIIPGSKNNPGRKRIYFVVGGNKEYFSPDAIQGYKFYQLIVVKVTKASNSGGIVEIEVLRELEEK